MLRSGRLAVVLTGARSYIRSGASTPIEVEAARDHELRRAAEREAERLLLALEHAMLVVEAVEVVGDADRVGRDRLRPALLRRLRDDRRQLEQPLDQLALLRRERRRSAPATISAPPAFRRMPAMRACAYCT